MNLNDFYTCDENQKPLGKVAVDGGFCGVSRTIAVVGDSMSSGEFQSYDAESKAGIS